MSVKARCELVFSSPLVTFAFGLVVLVLGYNMNGALANGLLVASWLLFVVFFVSLDPFPRQSPIVRGLLTTLFAIVLAIALYVYLWTPSRTAITSEFLQLARSHRWSELVERLPSIEGNPALRDAWLYFRGMSYLETQPGPDPEQILLLVPPNSEYWVDTQRLRLLNWARNGRQPRRAALIADSLDRSGGYISIFYRLRLENAALTFDDIAELYYDFTQRFADLFDFVQMKVHMRLTVNTPVAVNMIEVARVPGLVSLFLARLIRTAHNECLAAKKQEMLERYDLLVKNNKKNMERRGPANTFGLLQINGPLLQRDIDFLRNEPLPAKCLQRTSL